MPVRQRAHNQGSVSWVSLYEALADAACAYADTGRREALFDLLAEALDRWAISFPVMHSGEALESIDPFTFFASFNWPYCSEQRAALLAELVSLFGLDNPASERPFSAAPFAEQPAIHSATDAAINHGLDHRVGHGFFVDEHELRFFAFDEQRSGREKELLWALFLAALALADYPTEACRLRFVRAYNQLLSQRVKGASVITVALHWVRPRFFLPVQERFGKQWAAQLGYDLAFFSKTPSAEAYLQFLDDCARLPCEAAREEQPPSPAHLACYAWQATEPALPVIDALKTERFLRECLPHLEMLHAKNAQLWRAVRCFKENWNLGAADVATMLKSALAEHGNLLSPSALFDPYREILLFARKEPETVRASFEILFDPELPLCTRLIRFEEATSALYTRYRGDMMRAYAKRSAHGNYTALATYLFLRFPDSCYLYSPLRINAITPRVGYPAVIRVARPESVRQYFELCDQIRERILANGELLPAAAQFINPAEEYSDSAHHLLLEDLITHTL